MVYLWDDELGLQVTPFREFNYAYKRHNKGEYVSMYGDRLKRVERFKYDDPDVFESDLPRETRVLTDLYLDSDEASKNHRILCMDIEVSSEGGFAKPDQATNSITAIANYAYNRDEYMVFLLDPEGRVKTRTNGNKTVISCPTERDLLTQWMAYYTALEPTIITGWNLDGYDIPYVYNRLKRVFGMPMASKLSPVGLIKYSEQRMRYVIAGVSCLDYLPLYKKFTYNQKVSYRLDAIARDEIGKGKVEYTGTLDQLFATDIEKFLDYNLNDVELVVGIDRKMKLIELARFICHIGHVPYEDYAYSSKFIEGTIVTYLHRKGIIASNKPAGGREEFDKKMESDEEGFEGAYVKSPLPGLYEWVYSLDLESLYPSLIMSLNISPETKFGRVYNWDVDTFVAKTQEHYEVQIGGNAVETMTRTELQQYLRTNMLSLSSNGIMYTNHKVGIIPEILDKWFAERKKYKGLMFQYEKEGNTELKDFYDRRQHVQKILLNSIYGVLGLSIFRFYDLDNALAVTASGQDVIKSTAKFINSQYKARGVPPKSPQEVDRYWSVLKAEAKRLKKPDPAKPSPEDHCIYIDTDSVYFSAQPLFFTLAQENEVRSPEEEREHRMQMTVQVAREMEEKANKFYTVLAKMIFNCDKHRLRTKGESIIETGLWVAKKRYAMKKVYDLESNAPITKDKPAVKGLDVVRSSFPKAFATFMTQVLKAILNRADKSVVDKMILDFKKEMKTYDVVSIAKNTSVKDMTKWANAKAVEVRTWERTVFISGTPAHYKAALAYNQLLQYYGLENKYMPITDGDKIKWVYLKKNQFDLDALAIKTYDDPPQILELIEKYADYEKQFEKELENKLVDFYGALDWGEQPVAENELANKYFDFV